MESKKYETPKMIVIELSPSGCILQLSNFGNPGTPGSGFGIDGGIIDNGDF